MKRENIKLIKDLCEKSNELIRDSFDRQVASIECAILANVISFYDEDSKDNKDKLFEIIESYIHTLKN